jgi:SAM-dependent methyltransferase
MHDTAFHIGTLAMNIYADLAHGSIAEIGSRAVNGSLRENALPTTRYVGVDIEDGEGVDLISRPGEPLPLDDSSFDLVIATSVFEHDPCFWMTFLEMCRVAKDGGYIYISAPSNGVIHRYPQDNWRFYPDSGRALAQWAVSQGVHVALVESFIADRDADIWNDFVAVFRKGRITKALPNVFIHEHVRCANVITWKSPEVLKSRDEPEDMILLKKAKAEAAETAEAAGALARRVEKVEQRRDSLEHEIEVLREERKRWGREVSEATQAADRIRNDLALKDSELRQRQEEIEQTRLELASASAELKELRSRAERLEAAATAAQDRWRFREAELNKKLEQTIAERTAMESQLSGQSREIALLTRQLQRCHSDLAEASEVIARQKADFAESLKQARDEKEIAETEVHERFREVAELTNAIIRHEALERRTAVQLEWLRNTGAVLSNGSKTLKGRLLALLPAVYHYKRQRRLLRRKGLFDDQAYLEANPDVAADGADPLCHYLKHGINENRRRF